MKCIIITGEDQLPLCMLARRCDCEAENTDNTKSNFGLENGGLEVWFMEC